MSWLDRFFGGGGYSKIQSNGTNLPLETVLNFLTGFSVVDNPGNGSTDVTNTGGGGGGGSVTSVFGRTGAVAAQTGDYTAAQVGAVPTTRTITTTGLLTGGADLSANRTFTVTAGANGDIARLGSTAAAGSSGKAADAAHVHPASTTETLRAGSTSSHSEQTGSVVATSSGSTAARGFVGWQFSADAFSSRFFMAKARGTEGTPAAVQNADGIMNLVCAGFDGTNFIESARITALIDGSVSAGVVPMSLNFYTGNSSSPTLRLAISSAGVFDFQSSPVQGGSVVSVAVSSTPFTVTTSGVFHKIATGTIVATVNLPNPANGGIYIFKDKDGSAYTHNITFHRFGSEKIEGTAADLVVTSPYGCWVFISDGTDWWVAGPI